MRDAERLAEAGLLTERQAEAFVLRRVEAVPREGAAQAMEISPNTLDEYLRAAADKIEAAEETLETLEEIRHEDLPSRCANCGDALGGRYTVEEGEPFCLPCAGIEERIS
jgi:formylmethanofuran dehydrogenase subunit E